MMKRILITIIVIILILIVLVNMQVDIKRAVESSNLLTVRFYYTTKKHKSSLILYYKLTKKVSKSLICDKKVLAPKKFFKKVPAILPESRIFRRPQKHLDSES